MSATTAELASNLLAWYDENGRELPWRTKGPRRAEPYHVWLSEIMLQQTTVTAVIPYFHRLLGRWPTLGALAAASLADVLQAWAGLGYYARGRNLHKCARMVAVDFGGKFPEEEMALKALPGIGNYTAAAIAAIAFGRPANVVDGNVERVIARLRAVDQPLPGAKQQLRILAGEIAPESRPGDYAQALMDLGATVCTPRAPACGICPWIESCWAHASGTVEAYPRRAEKRPKPIRHGIAYWIERNNDVLLERRPAHGLLGGMLCFPGSEWIESKEDGGGVPRLEAGGSLLPGEVHHTFTHFHLILRVSVVSVKKQKSAGMQKQWHPVSRLDEAGLPSVMRKVANHALGAIEAAEKTLS